MFNYFQYRLKGISLLPRHELGAYKQMPYEAITEKEYNKQVKKLGHLSFVGVEGEEAEVDKFCNNDICEIPGELIKNTWLVLFYFVYSYITNRDFLI